MKPFSLFAAASAAVLVALLTACTSATTEKEPLSSPPQAGVSADAAPATGAITSAPPAPTTLPLRETVWAWQYTQLSTQQSDARIAPAIPAHYTLTFQEENRLAIAADCNRGGTVYRIQGDLLTLDLIAMTKMMCPAGSLDRDFLNGLHEIERYRIDGRTLTLQLRSGGEMVFAP